MAQKTVQVLDIGDVVISKRRGAKNIRLSVTSTGKVRVSLPLWVPYSAGVIFARQRAAWIQKQQKTHQKVEFKHGMAIGKRHRLIFIRDGARKQITAKVSASKVKVTSPLALTDEKTQKRVEAACEKALALETRELILPRLKSLADKNSFSYKTVEVKKLRSRWGSCTNKKMITVSIYLVQLPWDFIDYVLLHELVHTEHMNHSQEFWRRFSEVMPAARSLQKGMRLYRPMIHQTIE